MSRLWEIAFAERSSGWNVRRFQRKRKREHGALPELADHADGSTVRFHHGFRDSETHPRTLHGVAVVFSAIKLLKDHRLLKFIDAGATVRDTDDDFTWGLLHRDVDGGLRR